MRRRQLRRTRTILRDTTGRSLSVFEGVGQRLGKRNMYRRRLGAVLFFVYGGSVAGPKSQWGWVLVGEQ